MLETRLNPIQKLILFFVIAYGLTWAAWVPMVVWFPNRILHPIGSLGPLAAAIVTAYLTEGARGARAVLSAVGRWRVNWRWYALVLLGPFVLYGLAALASWAITGTMPPFSRFLETQEWGNLGLWYWLIAIGCYGFGEEGGWRGFALPRLIDSGMNPTNASAVFSVCWALWHAPLFWHSGLLGSMNPILIIGWYFSLLLSSYLLTWIWQSASGSVLIVALFHGTTDIVVTTRAAENGISMGITMLLLVAGLLVVRRYAPELKASAILRTQASA